MTQFCAKDKMWAAKGDFLAEPIVLADLVVLLLIIAYWYV